MGDKELIEGVLKGKSEIEEYKVAPVETGGYNIMLKINGKYKGGYIEEIKSKGSIEDFINKITN